MTNTDLTTTATDISVRAQTIGEAWLEIARGILEHGVASRYDGLPIVEVPRVTITVQSPRTIDPVVLEFGDAARLEWMHANFTDHSLVPELGDARSYASRLFDYAGVGRDQVDWVIERLRADPTSRSATITTFEPLLDTTYIPCVSLLDFWIRDGALEQVVYAHSIDFGAKGYGNLVELAWLQEHVASELGIPVGRLDFLIKSAHVYDTEREYMKTVLARVDRVG
jgi:thymidylate synthase